MHIYNRAHVLLSTTSYMYRHLLCHLQGELSRFLKTIVIIVSILYYGYSYYTKTTWNGKLHAKFILFGLQIVLNVIAVVLNVTVFRMQEADSGFVLVIDRRNDKWHSVKTVLLKISVGI